MLSGQKARWIGLLWLLFSVMGQASAAQGWPRAVSNDGETLTLNQPPQRIVSTSVTLTGSLLAIDAPVVASGATAPDSRFADNQGFLRQWGDIARQRDVQRLYIGEVSAESVAAAAPDLIIVSSSGYDSAIRQLSQLQAIAPVLVVNYADKSWQQIITLLGQATGHEQQATERISGFEQRVSSLKPRLALPPQPVSAMVWNGEGREVNLWTAASAQGKLLQELGFSLAVPPETVRGNTSMGQREDIIQLSGEQVAEGLNGKSWLLFASGEQAVQQVQNNRFLMQAAAVRDKQVYSLGNDNFRMDYYSASHLLDTLQRLFSH
ncbi:Fe2+-enterobactin ABC transporter substrate-binding protein [Tatumella saanichensis]|uniref:Fe2+-enterobactin ABC transporter substrate-binding protein n=1 Tax=Tatumella saanichensis TaxID=480813 RepID=UPI0004A3495E